MFSIINMTGDVVGPKIMRKGGGGGTSTTTSTSGIAPEFKPAVTKTIDEAGQLYDTGQLGQVADTSGVSSGLAGITDATRQSVAGQQQALGDYQNTLRGLQAQAGGPNTDARRQLAIQDAQNALGQQRGAQALTGGLGGARALRAENQLATQLGTNLAALDETAGQQRRAEQAGYAQQIGQAGQTSAQLGLQPAQAQLAQATGQQQLQQQQLDAAGQALAQYGQLLQTPGSFAGTQSTVTAPRQGGK